VTALRWASISTPVGPVSVGCTGAGVARVRFGTPPTEPATARPAAAGNGPAAPGADGAARECAQRARTQLAEYLSGRRRAFDLPLDWTGCAPLHRQILSTLAGSVGYGQTVSYGELARRSRLPAAIELPAKTVGQVMASNPIPVIVPCHRVLASDGLGGYSGGAGLEVKRWLLTLEGALPPVLFWGA
jgi:methylated-DNA-[protein]-cysteine S-methyltransferase